MAERKEKNLQESMIEIQKRLKAPKGQYNSFGKYKYRSCEDILEAVKPLLAELGVLLTITDLVTEIGTRVYVKATATVSKGDGSISITAYAREDDNKKGMDGSQITGTASSYARKYALNGLFLIDDTKDSDTNEHRNQQDAANRPEPKPYPELTDDQMFIAEAEAENCTTIEALSACYNKYAALDKRYIREGGIFMKALSKKKKQLQQQKTTLF